MATSTPAGAAGQEDTRAEAREDAQEHAQVREQERAQERERARAEGLALVQRYGAAEHWLAVLVTVRPDGRPATSVINGGVLPHPVSGDPTVAFVARGRTAKLAHLRARPWASLVFRSGWEWVSVHGPVELAGPDDPLDGLPADGLPALLRDVFHAAGGAHDDLAVYDQVMATERRTAVLLRPQRFATNPPGTDHEEHP